MTRSENQHNKTPFQTSSEHQKAFVRYPKSIKMPPSVGSATPSNNHHDYGTRGRVVVLEMQVAQLNATLNQHLSIISDLAATLARLEMSMSSQQEPSLEPNSSDHDKKHGKKGHRKHRH
jgi:hypothetical protein